MNPTQHTAGTPESQQRLADWRLGQVVSDTYELSKVGGLLYVFGWAVIAWLGDVMAFAPRAALAFGAGFVALGVLRLAMRPPPQGL